MNYTEIMLTECSDLSGQEETRMITICEEVADLSISQFINRFIRPMLAAIGHTDATINEYLGEYIDED